MRGLHDRLVALTVNGDEAALIRWCLQRRLEEVEAQARLLQEVQTREISDDERVALGPWTVGLATADIREQADAWVSLVAAYRHLLAQIENSLARGWPDGGAVNEYHKIQKERFAMEREFDRRVADLQASCPHKDLTGWLTGYRCEGRLCRRCSKQVERRDVPGVIKEP